MFKQKFAIKTLNTILITDATNETLLSNNDKFVFLSLLLDNGYALEIDDLSKFMEIDFSLKNAKDVFDSVKSILGSDVNHYTIMTDFPNQNSNQFGRSLTSYVNHLSIFCKDIPTFLQEDAALYGMKEKGNIKILALSDNIDQEIKKVFYTKVPLSLDHEQFVTYLFENKDSVINDIDPKDIILKEVLARMIAHELTSGVENLSARNAIDILRAIALLSGQPDAKLDEKFRIKSLSNPMRKAIVKSLNEVATIEDLTSKKGLFKKLFKILHVHESRFNKYSKIQALAKKLQTVNNPETNRTHLYNLVNGVWSQKGVEVIINNPSIMIRNLDALLRKYDKSSVLECFSESLTKRDVETKLLLQILEHFRNRDKDSEIRLFKLKGKSNPVLVDKPLKALDAEIIKEVENIIKSELKRQYSKGDAYFENVYIHPDLYKITLPKHLSNQDGIKTVGRGSRYKINVDGNTIRMFVHWKGINDIDLSATLLDSEFNIRENINFRNLSGNYFEHSGDVRSAPKGGSEYIDIYKEKLPKDVKYIGMYVNCYDGEEYDNIKELFGGFMIRKDRLAGKKFEPKTVEEKFSITGGRDFKVLVLFDVESNEVIMINSAMNSGRGSSIVDFDFADHIKSIVEYKYVTVGEVIELHAKNVVDDYSNIDDVNVFDREYGFDVIDINSKMI